MDTLLMVTILDESLIHPLHHHIHDHLMYIVFIAALGLAVA